ncbi:MAG: hypothetical protein NC489_45900 [Ruminococcus flavefaciens]|nr:hypothetical protein [Ruminococcus flavefaciens]
MLRLVYYECRKHFLTPAVFIMLAFFLIINGIKIYSVYWQNSIFANINNSNFLNAYEDFYSGYKGMLTDEKLQNLWNIYNPIREKADSRLASTEVDENSYTGNCYSDRLFFDQCFVRQSEYDTSYQEYAAGIVSRAKENLSFYRESGNSYEYRKNYRIARAFYRRNITDFYNHDMYKVLVDYNFSSLFIILLLVYGCTSVFVKDEDTQMRYLLATSVKGKTDSFIAKLTSVFLFSVVMGGVFSMENWGLFHIFYEFDDAGNQPVYVIQAFQDTPLCLSLKMSVLLFSGIRTMGFFFLGLLFVCISLFFKRTIPVFLANCLVTLVLVRIQETFQGIGKLCSPMALICSQDMFRETAFVRIGNMPVQRFVYALCMGSIIASGIVFLCRKEWEKRCSR